ncbi:MAG: baseplate J/gp47 family protein, partial [Synergistaceae bacterium]|nr:baseplate J/gp47 family protein [Synergistaceae bacterium]
TLRYELSAPQSQAIVIPAGTRATPDGNIYFATTEAVEIPAGETSVDVTAQCSVAGVSGNGWTPGQINQEVDRLVWVKSVVNVTTSSGGEDEEDDENYRARIQISPESYSVAGPTGAYIYHAKSVNQGNIDVAVLGPDKSTDEHVIEPCNIEIYPLMTGGELPSQDILDAVYEACGTDNDVRPDTDCVHVLTPETVHYDLNVTYWIDRGNATLAASIQAAVETAVNGWVLWQRSRLGRDINPSELTRRMVVAGAKRVEIGSPAFRKLEPWQLAIPDNTKSQGERTPRTPQGVIGYFPA